VFIISLAAINQISTLIGISLEIENSNHEEMSLLRGGNPRGSGEVQALHGISGPFQAASDYAGPFKKRCALVL
jgi:hypothetical protein